MKALAIGCVVAMALGIGAGAALRPEPRPAGASLAPQVVVDEAGGEAHAMPGESSRYAG
jgi:hypothetical protein